ncbi:MAG TPA: DUF2059 domain-containing protein [Stellaceae bacterium]|nr:DUF2059 domain-containing protein [Stellaceae bacterium]
MRRLIPLMIAIVIGVCGMGLQPAAAQQSDPAKTALINEMMQLTNMTNLVQQMANQMTDQFIQAIAKIPSKDGNPMPQDVAEVIKTEIKAEFKETTPDLLQRIAAIYERYYTTEDLSAIVAFYKSPAGQKVLKTLPNVMQESAAAGQAWGQAATPRVQARVEKKLKELGYTDQ